MYSDSIQAGVVNLGICFEGVNVVNAQGEKIRGSCVCGAVTFVVVEPFRFFQYCHCSRCRKRSGSLHAANVAVKSDQFAFTSGMEFVQTFALASAEHWGNAFCRTCGSGLPWATRNGAAYIVPAGAFDDVPHAYPTRNIHEASKAAWHRLASTLEHHDEDPPR